MVKTIEDHTVNGKVRNVEIRRRGDASISEWDRIVSSGLGVGKE